MADEPRLRLIGWGPFRLLGEARRWAEAEERARNTHALASAPAARPPATPSPSGNGTAAPATASAPSAAPASEPGAQPEPPAEAPEPVARRVMEPLTVEERTMVELLAEGHNVSAIAKDLSISTRRVTSALVTINRKTGRFDQAGFAELLAHLRLAESRAPVDAPAADPPPPPTPD